MAEWQVAARAALGTGPAALVTVLATEGSVPREAGTRMIVTGAASHGTIGGGNLEHQAIAQARAILPHPPGAWRVQDYPLGPLLGQCCGGRVRLLVERLDPDDAGWLNAEDGLLVTRFGSDRVTHAIGEGVAVTLPARGLPPAAGDVIAERIGEQRRPLLLFGAGHVGRAIAQAAAGLPFTLTWLDTRTAADAPGVGIVDDDAAVTIAGEAMADAAILILTHDHALDYRFASAAIGSQAAFVGMIGSSTKRARFAGRLARDGVPVAMIGRLTCPIGLPGIAGKAPAVIAHSALAQLLMLGPPA